MLQALQASINVYLLSFQMTTIVNGYKISDQSGLHFVTITVVEWVDVFTRKDYRDIIIDSLNYCARKKGLIIFAYVIMSNHLHLIIKAKKYSRLSKIIGEFKTYTSKEIISSIKGNREESRKKWMLKIFSTDGFSKKDQQYRFWQRGSHPVELYSPKWITTRLNYIHNNPVVAGLVEKPESYVYSSASNYKSGNGLIDVEIIDLGTSYGFVLM